MVITGEYPYTYARVSAMKSKLLNRNDYDKFQKMTVGEIIKFLSENEYKKEIEKFGVIKEGLDLMETILLENTSNTYKKLKRISHPEIKSLLDVHLIRNDVYNFKTILRASLVNNGANKNETKKLLISATKNSKKYFEMLLDEPNPEKIMNKFSFLNKTKLRESIKSFKESNNLILIENVLDHYMYNQIFEIESQLPDDSSIKELFRAEVQAINFKILLKMKYENKKKEDIIPLLIKPKKSTIILAEKSYDDILKDMKKTIFKEATKENNLLAIEAQIDKVAIQKVAKLLHQKPLSADIIVGYLFAKEIEMRNIRLIVKAKEFGLDEKFVLSQLVVAKWVKN